MFEHASDFPLGHVKEYEFYRSDRTSTMFGVLPTVVFLFIIIVVARDCKYEDHC